MFGELPADWARLDDAVLVRARDRTREALQDEDLLGSAGCLLTIGVRELRGCDLREAEPQSSIRVLSASDLLAVTMLSVEIPQVAVRRIAEPGPTAASLSRLLSNDALAIDLNLLVAGRETLSTMGELYEAVKAALAPVGVRGCLTAGLRPPRSALGSDRISFPFATTW